MRRAVVAVATSSAIARGSAAELRNALGCTALAADGGALEDGSALAGMNADCPGDCDGRLNFVPARSQPAGAARQVYMFKPSAPRWVGHGRGELYEPSEGDATTPPLGSIPEVRKTFGYWESVLPLMNEAGLGLGESSCMARLINHPKGRPPGDELKGRIAPGEALLDITTLMQLALERCATALCGVETMGALAEEHGFFPMVGEWNAGRSPDGTFSFDDGGEAVTLSDRTGEAWVFHVLGGVPGITKSIWAAQRVPKGHVAFVANGFTIKDLPNTTSDDFKFSRHLHLAAKVAGLWDGRSPLNFQRAFQPEPLTFESPAGSTPIPSNTAIRLWRMLQLVAPSSELPPPLDQTRYPFSIKAERRLKHTDMMAFLGDLYEGTEFDLTLGALAGPFGNPFQTTGGPSGSFGQWPRAIAQSSTLYSVLTQPRREGNESIMWFAADTPVSSVFVPFYPAAGALHANAYSVGTVRELRRDSAWWAFNFVANWAGCVNWRNASGDSINPLKWQLQASIEVQRAAAEQRARREGAEAALGAWQKELQQHVVDRWWRLADELIVKYSDGGYTDVKSNKIGVSIGLPLWWARAIGFDNDVHPIWLKRDRAADAAFAAGTQLPPPGYVAPQNPLPSAYDFSSASWSYAAGAPASDDPAAMRTERLLQSGGVLIIGIAIGFFFGRTSGRRSRDSEMKTRLLG